LSLRCIAFPRCLWYALIDLLHIPYEWNKRRWTGRWHAIETPDQLRRLKAQAANAAAAGAAAVLRVALYKCKQSSAAEVDCARRAINLQVSPQTFLPVAVMHLLTSYVVSVELFMNLHRNSRLMPILC